VIYFGGPTVAGERGPTIVLRTIRSLVGGDGDHIVYECRHCGTTVEEPAENCPACGDTEIARFVL
jgi:rubrerythrin